MKKILLGVLLSGIIGNASAVSERAAEQTRREAERARWDAERAKWEAEQAKWEAEQAKRVTAQEAGLSKEGRERLSQIEGGEGKIKALIDQLQALEQETVEHVVLDIQKIRAEFDSLKALPPADQEPGSYQALLDQLNALNETLNVSRIDANPAYSHINLWDRLIELAATKDKRLDSDWRQWIRAVRAARQKLGAAWTTASLLHKEIRETLTSLHTGAVSATAAQSPETQPLQRPSTSQEEDITSGRVTIKALIDRLQALEQETVEHVVLDIQKIRAEFDSLKARPPADQEPGSYQALLDQLDKTLDRVETVSNHMHLWDDPIGLAATKDERLIGDWIQWQRAVIAANPKLWDVQDTADQLEKEIRETLTSLHTGAVRSATE